MVNHSIEETNMTRSQKKTSVEAVAVPLRCIKAGCADQSQTLVAVLPPCRPVPAPAPSDPTETLHGRPSRERGKIKKKSAHLSFRRVSARGLNGKNTNITDVTLSP